VALVVTGADKRRGREQAPSPTPVKRLAASLRLPVSHKVADVTSVDAELGVVVAFGRIIKPDVLARLEMVNVHFSLLPRWRGAAPVERAILSGDLTTGVCLMEVEEGLDTGGIYRRVEVPMAPHESAAKLTERLARLGATVLVEGLAAGLGVPERQHGEPTYAAKITQSDLRLDFTRPAYELERVVLVGRAWTTWRGRRLLVLDAVAEHLPPLPGVVTLPGSIDPDCRVLAGQGALKLITVQPEGRSPVAASDWQRGARPDPGERLGG
jgi:methionyl-tRNA formyltransferase